MPVKKEIEVYPEKTILAERFNILGKSIKIQIDEFESKRTDKAFILSFNKNLRSFQEIK